MRVAVNSASGEELTVLADDFWFGSVWERAALVVVQRLAGPAAAIFCEKVAGAHGPLSFAGLARPC